MPCTSSKRWESYLARPPDSAVVNGKWLFSGKMIPADRWPSLVLSLGNSGNVEAQGRKAASRVEQCWLPFRTRHEARKIRQTRARGEGEDSWNHRAPTEIRTPCGVRISSAAHPATWSSPLTHGPIDTTETTARSTVTRSRQSGTLSGSTLVVLSAEYRFY